MTSIFGGGPSITSEALAVGPRLARSAVGNQATAPTPLPPPTMPDPFSPAFLEAQRRQQAAANTGGRSSTVLSTIASRAQGTLAGGGGGAAYGGLKLGSS